MSKDPERSKEEILAELAQARDSFEKGEIKSELPDGAFKGLLDRAYKAATDMNAGVLTEIFGFYRAMAQHNRAAMGAMPHADRLARTVSDQSLGMMTENLEAHTGASEVDPSKMPWQYRK